MTAAVPSDSAKSRPSERMYVPLPHSTSKTNSGYRYDLISKRCTVIGRGFKSTGLPLRAKS